MTVVAPAPTLASGVAASWPTVTVVMPCRNEAAHIEACLTAVMDFDYPEDRIGVVVVDGMSDDGTCKILQRLAAETPRLRVLANPARLPAPGLNAAIEASDSEIILRVDAHTLYPRGYAALCIRTLCEAGADNVGGVVAARPGSETQMGRAIAMAMSMRFGVGNATFRTGSTGRRWADTVPFGCWHRKTLVTLGGFATDLPYAEDDELNARLHRDGGRILLDPMISAVYFTRPTLRSLAVQMYRYGRYKPLSARRVGRITTMRQLAPPLFVGGVLGTALAAIVVPAAGLLAVAAVAAHAAVGTAIAAMEAPRQGPGIAFRLPLVFLTMHGAYGLGYIVGCLALLTTRPPLRKT